MDRPHPCQTRGHSRAEISTPSTPGCSAGRRADPRGPDPADRDRRRLDCHRLSRRYWAPTDPGREPRYRALRAGAAGPGGGNLEWARVAPALPCPPNLPRTSENALRQAQSDHYLRDETRNEKGFKQWSTRRSPGSDVSREETKRGSARRRRSWILKPLSSARGHDSGAFHDRAACWSLERPGQAVPQESRVRQELHLLMQRRWLSRRRRHRSQMGLENVYEMEVESPREEGRLPVAERTANAVLSGTVRTGGEGSSKFSRRGRPPRRLVSPASTIRLYDALIRQHDIAHVITRHEQGAGSWPSQGRGPRVTRVVVVTTGRRANVLTTLVESFRRPAHPGPHVRHPRGADRQRPGRAPRGGQPDRLLQARLRLGRDHLRRAGDPRRRRARLPSLPHGAPAARRALAADRSARCEVRRPARDVLRRAAGVRPAADRRRREAATPSEAAAHRCRRRRDLRRGFRGARSVGAPARRSGRHVGDGARAIPEN